jgi:hypothetical protein
MPCIGGRALGLGHRIHGVLGFLLAMLLLLWLKHGLESGDAVFKNKAVASRSLLPEICNEFDELSTGRGGEGVCRPG